MYYDTQGREIEDAEMDNMRRDAAEQRWEPIVIEMEDEIVHSAERPVCEDPTCPCQVEPDYFIQCEWCGRWTDMRDYPPYTEFCLSTFVCETCQA